MTEPATISQRVAGRRVADEIIDLINGEVAGLTDQGRVAFWQRLRGLLRQPPAAAQAPIKPMNDAQCRNFEKSLMPFGRFAGVPIGDVELTYLDWLIGQKDATKESVARYLANPGIAERLRAELEL